MDINLSIPFVIALSIAAIVAMYYLLPHTRIISLRRISFSKLASMLVTEPLSVSYREVCKNEQVDSEVLLYVLANRFIRIDYLKGERNEFLYIYVTAQSYIKVCFENESLVDIEFKGDIQTRKEVSHMNRNVLFSILRTVQETVK